MEQMIQLIAYNQLLMSQPADIQEEPLDLSLPSKSRRSSNRREVATTEEQSTSCSPKAKRACASPDVKGHFTVPLSPISVADSNPSDCSSDGDSSYLDEARCPVRQGKPLLWHFLYNILESARFHEVIIWLDREGGLFVIRQPELLAKMWGQCKSNPNMTFECLSRSLRAYYQKGIISKTSRLQYQFSCQALISLQASNGSSIAAVMPVQDN